MRTPIMVYLNFDGTSPPLLHGLPSPPMALAREWDAFPSPLMGCLLHHGLPFDGIPSCLYSTPFTSIILWLLLMMPAHPNARGLASLALSLRWHAFPLDHGMPSLASRWDAMEARR
jgi:hypothetical protein